MNGIEFTLVDKDFYVPIEKSRAGAPYRPTSPPAGWLHRDAGVFSHWTPPEHVLPVQGWKVHVSTRLERAQHVLDVVARVCGEHDTPFKHVRDELMFLWLHHKHGPRTQSGKFCTAYPVDVPVARALMSALSAALPDETGPYVLTDRRFAGSGVVSYRYGSFTPRFRVQPDGTAAPVITGADGVEVADRREPRFLLPPGVDDPFAPPPEGTVAGPVGLRGYTFTAVLQFSNAGGAYRATAPDGRAVFVKEARNHNGYQWDRSTAMQRLRREHETLQRLHAADPGLCPAPIEYFRHWEHEFLVTELVPGVPLLSWASRLNPVARTGATGAESVAYHDRCRALLSALREQVRRVHAAGYAFVDLNPHNVLVDERDHPRLIDFEEAQPLGEPRLVHGAEGFLPPEALRERIRPDRVDEYALGALAELLVQPIQGVLERHPAGVAHMLADLPPLPADLRAAAPRLRRRRIVSPLLPAPRLVAAEPERWLAWLADRVANGLEAMVDPSADLPYPLGPRAYSTNPHGVAYGTAGILYALHRAGHPVDTRVVGRLVDAVLADADNLPPGLLVGTAGMAWVLAGLGRVEVARKLLSVADRYPLAGRDATLAYGTAGLALAHLALARFDGDPAHVTRAADLLDGVPDGEALRPLLGPDESTGWETGRPGIALALHYLSAATGDPVAGRRGRALLLAELDQSYVDGDGLQFHVSRRDGRMEPYLAAGSAGFAFVAGRYGAAAGRQGDPLAAAYRRCLATIRSVVYPVLPSLFHGLAGMGLVLSDLGSLTGSQQAREGAIRTGRALFKYAVPRAGTVCFLGLGNRFGVDLAGGAAGVLLFLAQLRDGRPDALFTLDAPGDGETLAGTPDQRGA